MKDQNVCEQIAVLERDRAEAQARVVQLKADLAAAEKHYASFEYSIDLAYRTMYQASVEAMSHAEFYGLCSAVLRERDKRTIARRATEEV